MDYSKIYQEAQLMKSFSQLHETVKKIDEINWGEKSMDERRAFLKEKISEVHNNLFEVSSKIKDTMVQIKSDISPEAKEIKKKLNEMLGLIQDIIMLLNKPGLKEIYEEVQRESSPKSDNSDDTESQMISDGSEESDDISIEEAKEIQQEAADDLKDSAKGTDTTITIGTGNGGVN